MSRPPIQSVSRFEPVPPSAPSGLLSPSVEFNERLTTLYTLAQRSRHVFASPLGPFFNEDRYYHLPRFVYFGPHTSDESLRLAFIAGFDSSDLRGTLALMHFVERLALTPDVGQGLNLSFFPLADVTGLLRAEPQHLSGRSWLSPAVPEIKLLSLDARSSGYQGFIRVETHADAADVINLRLRGHSAEALGVELLNSADLAPWDVRWEAGPLDAPVTDGPLALSDDLPFQPFELTVSLPSAWPAEPHREAVTTVLNAFVLRYRGLHGYGQHI